MTFRLILVILVLYLLGLVCLIRIDKKLKKHYILGIEKRLVQIV